MNKETEKLLNQARKAAFDYNVGLITRKECKELVMPYINLYNEKSVEIAKKYNVNPKKINFCSFIR